MRACLSFVVIVVLGASVAAQEPVREVPDAASWATAAVNPAWAVYRAIRSDDPKCRLSRLLVAEGIGNGVSLLVKHVVRSPRPCLGCAADGMPSGHSMNSAIGMFSGSGWRIGVSSSFAVGTGGLRYAAHRHTTTQVAVGLLLGAGADAVSHALVRCS